MKRFIAVLCILPLFCLTAAAEAPSALTRGDILSFGHYEQDGILSDGDEAIEWIVLDSHDGTALLISRFALDCVPFHESKSSVTWETCSLRIWLNGTFFDRAFTAEEQAMIEINETAPDANPSFTSWPGKATQDRVFILSIDEALRYFRTDGARVCIPTAYAEKHGAVTYGSACWWLLRTPGVDNRSVACVNSNGKIGTGGYYADRATVALRPVIVLRISGR